MGEYFILFTNDKLIKINRSLDIVKELEFD
jgi:hypothetical protein